MAFARPGGALAPVHADARAPGHDAVAADRARRRPVAGRPRWPPLPRCDQQLVDQPVRPCRTADRRGHRAAGVDAGARDPRRVLACARQSSWPSACSPSRPAKPGASHWRRCSMPTMGRPESKSRLKMAFHWFRNRGELQRTKFVALENGYHGETIGALAVGDIPLYRRVYAPLLAEALFAPSPDAWLCEAGESPEQRAHARSRGFAPIAGTAFRRDLRADPGTARAVRWRHAHA